ncbi:MAG: hypothetical protein EXR98_09625 [Gemmataceae bacterium]|nr:hypothetical protein [Gemmataceae bacterium]
MKALLRPRLILSLLFGIAAGLLVWLLPPMPHSTVRLPNAGTQEYGQPPFWLVDVTSNGRFLITEGSHEVPRSAINKFYVWDRMRADDRPLVEIDPRGLFIRTQFSPDETQLAVYGTVEAHFAAAPHDIYLYDLASGAIVKQWELKVDHLLFSRHGKPMVVIDGVLSDLETGSEVRRLPKSIDDYDLQHHIGDLVEYRKEQYVRLYSWHAGELVAAHDLVGNRMGIQGLSRDGQVIHAYGWPPGVGPWTAKFMSVLLDAKANVRRTWEKHGMDRERVLSPDGQHLAEFGDAKRFAWLPKWWPGPESTPSVRFVHWTTDKELAKFSNISRIRFSPQGKRIALTRDDFAIDIYEFPFRKPWGSIAGAALLAAWGSWSVGWLWARWRARVKPQGGAA